MKIAENFQRGKKKRAVRALVLFSGGLDSILAVKILERQGIDVTALTFVSYFFGAEQAKKSAKENEISLIIKDVSKGHFGIVKNPYFGYGTGMNPCVDCHLFMLEEGKKIARKEKFDFIATGEVLGQRPMSQNRGALALIEKKAGLEGKILRPLSAKVLPETEIEKAGMIDREKLLGISGRSRKGQMELAKKYGIKNYPTPAGGCILTDQEYSRKLRELLEKIKIIKPSDFELLRIGRHFWVGNTKIILGRNHEENLQIKKIAEKDDAIVEPKSFSGPTAILRGRIIRKNIEFAEKKILQYSKKIEKKNVKFNIESIK